MDESPSSLTPRIRVERGIRRVDDHTPAAGPSRLSAMHSASLALSPIDLNDDTDTTPRPHPHPVLAPSATASPVDIRGPTPRIKDLLARFATSNDSRQTTQLLNERTPSLPSELESDFDTTHRSAGTSFATEALKSLFTHAMREPGDTPRKKARRNSIDTSEVEVVEDSPRLERIARERAKLKGKRKSMSDEEAEKSSSTSPYRPFTPGFTRIDRYLFH